MDEQIKKLALGKGEKKQTGQTYDSVLFFSICVLAADVEDSFLSICLVNSNPVY